ncbi:MAG: HPr family phosphocarrier protein [Chromatiaceae bacterium]|nr:HPr family phosphocarrier protein [Chromatiaceae bacterium]
MLFLPHLIVDTADRIPERVAWLFQEKRVDIEEFEAQATVCCFVVGPREFVTTLCRISVQLCEGTTFVQDAYQLGRDDEIRRLLRRLLPNIVEKPLTGSPQTEDDGVLGEPQGWFSDRAVIVNTLGMHARATARLNAVARSFACPIQLRCVGQRQSDWVNGKSIMEVMMLAGSVGSEIEIRARGKEGIAAVSFLIDYIDTGMDEDVTVDIRERVYRKKVLARTELPTRVVAKCDVGWGHEIFVRGDTPPLSWERGLAMSCIDKDIWLWEMPRLLLGSSFEFKLLRDDATWEVAVRDRIGEAGKVTVAFPEF